MQCAENLPDPIGTLRTTYPSSSAVRASTRTRPPATSYRWAPFQYVESHDHSRFVAAFGTTPFSDVQWEPYGDRNRWAKTQRYAIAV